MTSKINAVDLSAKLLATENISVRRANVKTASFDIVSRVLTLPLWKDMSPVVEGMLVGHEVGHALYTTEKYMQPIEQDHRIKGYLNILEDVRIEKLMKRKYPGIRKTMTEGYRELNEKDFFGVSKTDLSALLLIDRINIYFKVGYNSGVKFTPQEKMFVSRAEATETIEDVIQLAKEIYEFSRKDVKERLSRAKLDQQAEGDLEEEDFDDFDPDDLLEEDEDYGDYDVYGEEEEDEEKPKKTGKRGGGSEKQEKADKTDNTTAQQNPVSDEEVEQQLKSVTEKTFAEKLEEKADDSIQYNYYKLDSEYLFDPIIDFKTVIRDTAEMDVKTDSAYDRPYQELVESDKERLNKFKGESTRVVNYLVKEFEMKKSATLYKRAQTSKLGSLDMKKIWSYKLNDDLFKRVTTLPQGKNHGMIFLIDWSGSMDGVLEDTVEQVISLAMFCQRAQIPYQVLAFTTQYNRDDNVLAQKLNAKQYAAARSGSKYGTLSNAAHDFALLEFLSSKMSNVEFNTMVRRLHCFWKLRHCKNGAYSTGGTPLNEALAYMMVHIPKFVAANNIEKMSLITLSDGAGGQLFSLDQGRYSLDDYRTVYEPTYKRMKQKHFLYDDVTKNTYEIDRDSSYQTEQILRMIKDRYGVKTVGFYICQNSRRVLRDAIHDNLPKYNASSDAMIEDMRKEFRDKGFYSMKNTGRDDLFIVPQSSMKIDDSELKVNEDQSARQIAKNFTKLMTGKKTSRVLLNTFIGYVS